MSSFLIEGGRKIEGKIKIHGAKNAVLPILAAGILTDEEIILEDVPQLSDIQAMLEILKSLGAKARKKGQQVFVKSDSLKSGRIPNALSRKIRSSIFLLGPLLARIKKAAVPYPGGCEIGLRPIDLHLKGLKMLGVLIEDRGGEVFCDGRNMHAGHVYLDYPSVGATENLMMAAVFLPGFTIIHHAAREPEIEDLQRFLNRMGAKITGAGRNVIQVEGVEKLHGITYKPITDRIVAGTLLCAAANTGGSIFCEDAGTEELLPVIVKLKEMGCEIKMEEKGIFLQAPKRLRAVENIQTQPHPGFPTDMQSQMTALCACAKGCSLITENVFENRFGVAGDLCAMGADIQVTGRTAVIRGVEKLYGQKVSAHDLRGGAALILAALRAEGKTIVDQGEYVDRGYDHFENMLCALGAKAERI